MNNIQPFNVWANGQTYTATQIICNAQDNLINEAIFYWVLVDASNTQIASGYLTMGMPEYDNFTNNEFAFSWVCEQLGLTLLPETNTTENGSIETTEPSA